MEQKYRLSRLVRTPSSEIYLIWSGDERVGQVDVHYADSTIYGTVILEDDYVLEDEKKLLGILDDEIVSSYKSKMEREDFVIHVFRGNEISRYTDEPVMADEFDDYDEFEDLEDDDFDDDEEDEEDEEDDLS